MDKAFVKGLTVLELLAESAGPRGASDVGRHIGLTRSNAHRLLQTLARTGFAEANDDGKFTATLKLWELGGRVWAMNPIRRAVAPIAERLSREVGETVHVLYGEGDNLVFVEQIGGSDPLRSHWPLGTRMPLKLIHEEGRGLLAYQKAYLASLDLPDRETVIADFSRQLGNPADFVAAIRKDIDEARRLGAALHRGEWNADIRGTASCFFAADAGKIGVIGCVGPSDRLPEARLIQVAKLVGQAARYVTQELRGARIAP